MKDVHQLGHHLLAVRQAFCLFDALLPGSSVAFRLPPEVDTACTTPGCRLLRVLRWGMVSSCLRALRVGRAGGPLASVLETPPRRPLHFGLRTIVGLGGLLAVSGAPVESSLGGASVVGGGLMGCSSGSAPVEFTSGGPPAMGGSVGSSSGVTPLVDSSVGFFLGMAPVAFALGASASP
jgi:hypothetical protein